LLVVICLGVASALPLPAAAAEPAREIHGMSDAYAGDGVLLAWAIQHGSDEATSMVVLRIVADPERYSLVAAAGSNPFSGKSRSLLQATPTRDSAELRVARAQFADYPRTELRFYASAIAAQADAPGLIVYFLGVPDTTPELASAAAVNAYLTDRIGRLRAGGSRAP
jgi:hypothetical protein